MVFAAKAHITNFNARTFDFLAAKTMYGGKKIGLGDSIFVFASEKDGGHGLVARGVVTGATPIQKIGGVGRQTPRVSIEVQRTALARRQLGRAELKSFTDWNDGKPETELTLSSTGRPRTRSSASQKRQPSS